MTWCSREPSSWRSSRRLAAAAICAAAAGGYGSGWRAYVLLSASMAPALPAGSVILTKRQDRYGSGDIVTYRAPLAGSPLVTHRITETVGTGRTVSALTKGDANANGDPWSVGFAAITGKVRAHVPYAGYALGFERTRSGFLATLILALAVASRARRSGSRPARIRRPG